MDLGRLQHSKLLHFFVLLVLSFSCYYSIFNYDFIQFDDYQIVVNRADKYDGLTLENIADILFNDFPREEPLLVRDLSYLLNAQLFGTLNPFGYFFGNFLLYTVSGFLVYLLALNVTKGDEIFALLSGILFILHPIHVECVAWISARKDPLYVTFYLSGLLCYIKFLETDKGSPLVASVLLFLLALMSKLAAISFLPMLVLYRFCFYPKKPFALSEKIVLPVFFLLTVLYTAWYHHVLKSFGVFANQSNDSMNLGLWILTNIEIVTFYICKLLLPVHLAAIYDFPRPAKIFTHIPYLLFSIAVFAAYLIFLKRSFGKKDGSIFFLLSWFVVALAPYFSLGSMGFSVADRYLYLASVSFSIGGALALKSAIGFMASAPSTFLVKVPVIGFCAYCMTLFALTLNTTTIWSSSQLFQENIQRVSPQVKNSYAALLSLHTYNFMNDPDNPDLKKILTDETVKVQRIYEQFTQQHASPKGLALISESLAFAYYQLGKIDLAEKFYQKAIWLTPKSVRPRVEYIFFLLSQDRSNEALTEIHTVKGMSYSQLHAKWVERLNKIPHPVTTKTDPAMN